MKKTASVLLLLFVVLGVLSIAAWAEETEFDFLRLAKERVFPDLHPTVDIEEVKVAFDKKPYYEKEGFFRKIKFLRARVGIYYMGWLTKQSMVIEMDYLEEDNKIRVKVIEDSDLFGLGGRIFPNGKWVSLASVGWE